MKRIWFAGLCLCLSVLSGYGQHAPDVVTDQKKMVVFKFPFQCDTCYLFGNDVELKRLYAYIEQYQGEIASGVVSLDVNSYCSSFGDKNKNLRTASLRSNLVKSYLIRDKGLREKNFVTANHTAAYEGNRDVVTVTMQLPKEVGLVPTQRFITIYQTAGGRDTVSVVIPMRSGREAAVATGKERIRIDTLFNQSHPGLEDKDYITVYYTNVYEGGEDMVTVRMPLLRSVSTATAKGKTVQKRGNSTVAQLTALFKKLRFSVRTDLLCWLAVIPNGGIEWSRNPFDPWSILVNGYYNRLAWSGGEKQYRIGMVSPEIRYRIGEKKKWFVGGEFHTGHYNFKTSETGYQGNLTGGGITSGYLMRLNPVLDLDFHLGLGYTKLEYDTYYRFNEKTVRKEAGLNKNFIGPTQAGVSLVWRINHSK
jgi:hypothetical protein